MRCFGQTDAPHDPAAYCLTELGAGLEGLLDSLGLEDAIFVGHDWGALLLWQMATLVPHRTRRLVVLNIPHLPRTATDPIALMRVQFGDDFYIVNFQDSDEADTVFAADDVVVSVEQIEAMKSLVSNLTIEMLSPCGHWTQQERPMT